MEAGVTNHAWSVEEIVGLRGLKDLGTATRPQALASEHDQCGYHHKKRDWCIAEAMSGCGNSDRNTGPERERKQQCPSALDDHSTSQGDRQDQDDGHGRKGATESQPCPVGTSESLTSRAPILKRHESAT